MNTKVFALSLSLMVLAACENPASHQSLASALPVGQLAASQQPIYLPVAAAAPVTDLPPAASAPSSVIPSHAPESQQTLVALPSALPVSSPITSTATEQSEVQEPGLEKSRTDLIDPQSGDNTSHTENEDSPTEGIASSGLPPETVSEIQRLLSKEKQFREQLHSPELALQIIDQILVLDPDYAEAYLRRGRNQNMLAETEQAVLSFEKAVQLEPENSQYLAEFYFTQSGLAYEQKHFEQAFEMLKKAEKHNFNRMEVYGRYTLLYAVTGRYVEAKQSGQQAIEMGTRDGSLFSNLAIAFENTGDWKQAMAYYLQAVTLAPTDKVISRNKGTLHTRMQEYDLALESLNQALSLDSDYTDAHYEKAMAYYFMNRFQDALDSMNQALALDKTQPHFYQERAAIYAALGKDELAEADRQYAISLAWHN